MHDVAAIAPCISSDGRALSPFTLMKRWTLTKNIPDWFVGIPLEDVYAVNSASTIKVSALRAVGGYDPRFNLDFSDLAIYHLLHCQGLSVFVAGNIHVEHEVSVYDMRNRSTQAATKTLAVLKKPLMMSGWERSRCGANSKNYS